MHDTQNFTTLAMNLNKAIVLILNSVLSTFSHSMFLFICLISCCKTASSKVFIEIQFGVEFCLSLVNDVFTTYHINTIEIIVSVRYEVHHLPDLRKIGHQTEVR